VKRHVYAVMRVPAAEAGAPPLPPGVNCLVCGDLGVAYAEAEVRALTMSVPHLEEFAAVVAELHRWHTIVPFRYGCTFDSETELSALLEEHRPAWLASLHGVEQCDEYSVHLLPSSGTSAQETGVRAVFRGPEPEESTERPGTAYLLARRAELAHAECHQRHAEDRADQVRRAVDGHYRECYIDPGPQRPCELITLVFLVPRRSSSEFLAALAGLPEATSQQLLATGPWPPYHFVDLRTGLGFPGARKTLNSV